MKDILHIYSQPFEHQEAYIVGDELGLKKLRDALNEILAGTKDVANFNTFSADGEGFIGFVAKAKEEDLDTVNLPYTDHPYYHNAFKRKTPFEIVGREKYLKAHEELKAKYEKEKA